MATPSRPDRGHVEIILRFDLWSIYFENLDRTRELPVFEFEIDWQRLCLVAINQIQNESAVVPRGRTIEIGDVIESAIGVFGRIHKEFERRALRVGGEQLQWIVNRLQENAFFVSENGRNHVHQLRHVGHLEDMRVIDE